jgi:catechol 2,3-dioxygenase-like lactoylglutathione lyase family enzyme
MLGDKEALATIAVKDTAVADKFYKDILGLTPVAGAEKGVLMYRSGSSKLLVYQSQFAGTNQATAATWSVGADIDRLARELKAKGVVFERYDFPGMTREGDVHVAGNVRAAWFKDPDGNILSIVSQ